MIVDSTRDRRHVKWWRLAVVMIWLAVGGGTIFADNAPDQCSDDPKQQAPGLRVLRVEFFQNERV